MNILVTGCAGFIGSNLVEKLLLNSDNFVIGIDNFDTFYPKEIKQDNLSNFINNKKFEFNQTDITKKQELENIFSKHNIECVVHLAAKAGVRPSFDKQKEYIAINIDGTKNILDLMNKYNIQKLIFTSSSSVYGNADYEKLSEDIENLSPISPYANTKLECEKIIQEYTQKTNLNAICLRVYGKRQRPDLAITKFVNNIINDKEITIYGDGSTSRDYTYIDDTVNGIIEATKYPLKFEIINLGAGNSILLKDMVALIEKELEKSAKIKYLPMQKGDVFKTYSDISKAKQLLKWQPKTKFEQGLHQFIEFIRSEQK